MAIYIILQSYDIQAKVNKHKRNNQQKVHKTWLILCYSEFVLTFMAH